MPSKYDPINKIKAEKPELTWTEAAREAGFEGEFTSYKGKAKPRTGDARGQARRRAKFDQPSTEFAGYEAKKLKQQSASVNAQAKMFGLESTQIEHLTDQSDIQALTSGSGGDPTNLKIVKQSEARFKDRVKQIVGDDYGVTLNPAQESVKVIPKKFFDPIADANTLPGVDIPVGSKLNDADNIFAAFRKLVNVPGGRQALGLIPGGIGFGLNALGAVSDANAVTESATTPRTNDMKQTSKDLAGLGGVAGLLSLFSPHAAPAAIGLAGAQLAVENRIARDKDRELDVKQMDPATRTNFAASVDATITPTAPKSRIRGRSGAQKDLQQR